MMIDQIAQSSKKPTKIIALMILLSFPCAVLIAVMQSITVADVYTGNFRSSSSAVSKPGEFTALLADLRREQALSPQCGANMQKYTQLDEGISYNDAVTIMRCEGKEAARSSILNNTTVIYTWQSSFGYGNMSATFQNDRLISRAQAGLR